jgi:hypothetical protein
VPLLSPEAMTLNTCAYLIYLTITFMVTVNVGLLCYRNGIHFIREELGDIPLAIKVNRVLLTGYYLVNMGYAALMLNQWQSIATLADLVSSLGTKTGRIVLLLGCLHYLNMLVIFILRKKKPLNS